MLPPIFRRGVPPRAPHFADRTFLGQRIRPFSISHFSFSISRLRWVLVRQRHSWHRNLQTPSGIRLIVVEWCVMRVGVPPIFRRGVPPWAPHFADKPFLSEKTRTFSISHFSFSISRLRWVPVRQKHSWHRNLQTPSGIRLIVVEWCVMRVGVS